MKYLITCLLCSLLISPIIASASSEVTQLINKARTLFLSKEYEKAESVFLQVLKIDENNARAYCYLGMIYQENKDFSKAQQLHEKALAIDPDLKLAKMNLEYVKGKITKLQKQEKKGSSTEKQEDKRLVPKDYIEIIKDDFEDYVIHRMRGAKLGVDKTDDSIALDGADIWVNAQRIKQKDKVRYSFLVHYHELFGTWLSIRTDESLIFLVDGERYGVSRGWKAHDSDVRLTGQVEERAWYYVNPELIKRIAFAKEVRVKIIGLKYRPERYFRRCHFNAFRQFVFDFIDSYPNELETGKRNKSGIKFDIPALLKTNVSEIKRKLGKPDVEIVPKGQQWNFGFTGTVEYKKGTTCILIDYVKNGMIKLIFISDDTPGKTTEEIAKLGNIDLNSSNYKVRIQPWLNQELARQEKKSQVAGIEVSR